MVQMSASDVKSMVIPEDPSLLGTKTKDEATKILEYDTCKFACTLSKMVASFTQVFPS